MAAQCQSLMLMRGTNGHPVSPSSWEWQGARSTDGNGGCRWCLMESRAPVTGVPIFPCGVKRKPNVLQESAPPTLRLIVHLPSFCTCSNYRGSLSVPCLRPSHGLVPLPSIFPVPSLCLPNSNPSCRAQAKPGFLEGIRNPRLH